MDERSSKSLPLRSAGLVLAHGGPTAAAATCGRRDQSTAGSLRRHGAGAPTRSPEVRRALKRARGPKARCPAVRLGRRTAWPREAAAGTPFPLRAPSLPPVPLASSASAARGSDRPGLGLVPQCSGLPSIICIAQRPRAAASKDWKADSRRSHRGGTRILPGPGTEGAATAPNRRRSGSTEAGPLAPRLRSPKPSSQRRENTAPSRTPRTSRTAAIALMPEAKCAAGPATGVYMPSPGMGGCHQRPQTG
uniref:Uncharacterized protein n=1 Tax=Rousettus aegyptiacus TaxID=9407 RepID=A0A7J8F0T4_ROUAE|nr:hypothetical protein HJG63_012379 [Rousettus aegyptiacus]